MTPEKSPLVLSSPAKINLFLEVVGKRPDGFHDIESVFVEASLADTLTAEPAERGETVLTCDRPGVPAGPDNLVWRAASLLRRECGTDAGIRFRLEKRIPVGSGLGGGSSNAVAALRLANALWKTGLSDAELARLGAGLGSDVPFFFQGGLCLCRGRGEVVTPLPAFPGGIALGLALPPLRSDTAAAYRGLRLPGPGSVRKAEPLIRALAAGDMAAMAAAAFNRFEETLFISRPELGGIHRRLEHELDRPVRLTGSGAGLWFFRRTGADAAHPDGRLPLLAGGAAILPVEAGSRQLPGNRMDQA